MKKIAMFTMGTRGDVQPYIFLSKGLMKEGFDVILGSHPCWRGLVEEAGIHFEPIGPDIDIEEETSVIRGRSSNQLFSMLKTMNFVLRIIQGATNEVYELCNKVLQAPDMSVRKLIKMSNVTLICTTDDPVDTLEWHDKIKEDTSFDVKVLPAWRPDKAKNISKPEFTSYIKTLSEVSGVKINSLKFTLNKEGDFNVKTAAWSNIGVSGDYDFSATSLTNTYATIGKVLVIPQNVAAITINYTATILGYTYANKTRTIPVSKLGVASWEKGKKYIAPIDNTTRAEAATMIVNFLDNFGL